jgi:hypothetical protein
MRLDPSHRPRRSADQFDLTQSPFLREERFERAVEAKQREPTLAGQGLNPVTPLYPRRLGRTELDRRGAVRIRFGSGRRIALATGTRLALRRVEHRARLVVVEREGPERSGGNALRQHDFVRLAAVKVFLVCVQKAHEILRADPGKPHNHAGRVKGVSIVKRSFGIEGPRRKRDGASWRPSTVFS